MKYLLDTNVVIVYLKGKSEPLRVKLLATPIEDVAVCSIVKSELYAGSAKSKTPTKSRQKQDKFLNRFTSLPYDDAAAIRYGELRARLEITGKTIGPMDMLIAAVALANNLILVTHNTAEFQRIQGLSIEDWEV
jgi:tRNA(fMet)-specific endonuclease VapC